MMRTNLILPLSLGLAHGISDGVAGFLLAHLAYRHDIQTVGGLVLLYNALAFGAQPLAGWLTDRLKQPRAVALGGLALMGLGLIFLPTEPTLAVIGAGLASALFHVGGGALALCATRNRAIGPGLFAAPGVLGLALGGALAVWQPWLVWPFLVLLIGCGLLLSVLTLPELPYHKPESEPLFERHDWVMFGLLFAIACRSAVWSSIQWILQGRTEVLLGLAIAATIGKALGGLLADLVGWRRWTTGALLGAAILLLLSERNPVALYIGVGLLQSATPAAMAALAQQWPRAPATAAGLALGLGVALGGLPLLSDSAWMLNSVVSLGLLAFGAGALFWLSVSQRQTLKG